jgi:hypothetical protein
MNEVLHAKWSHWQSSVRMGSREPQCSGLGHLETGPPAINDN